MEEAKAMAQQQLMLQQHHQQQQQQQQQCQQQQQQQQLLLLQQIQQQKQQQQQQQQAAISRFPSYIDAHLRPPGLQHRSINTQQQQQQQQQQSPNLNPNPNPNPNSNSIPNQQQHQNPNSNPQQQQQQQQQQQKAIRPPANQVELQMAYQDAWRVCHPDIRGPFSSLEDACERLLPYHVVADYEAEEDDRILDSDTTGQMLSRSQQWDHNIAAKVAEFTATFEKQALAFNIISRKRALGEFRSEERLMIEQALLQEERRAMFEVRAKLESREKAGREAHEAKLRMAAMVQTEQARAESQAHAENMARAPIRGSALGSHGSSDLAIGHDMGEGEQEQGVSPDEMINGWGNNTHRDEKEPSEDFLNDEETDNGETSIQQHEWREVGEFDLNTR